LCPVPEPPVMLRAALAFPARGDRGAVSVLVGGVLVLVRWVLLAGTVGAASVAVAADGVGSAAAVGVLAVVLALLIVVELALRGYRIRALRAVVADPDADAPGFGRVGALYRDGLLGAGVTAAYALPGVLLLSVAAAGIGATPSVGPTSLGDAVARNLAGLALLFGLLVLVGAAYLLPAASASAAYDRSFRAAFHRRVVAGALSEDYAVGWLTAGVLAFLAFPAVLAVSALAVLPLLAAPFGSFFVVVASRHLYGAGFGVAVGLAAPAPDAEVPAAGPDEEPTDERRPSARTEPDGTARPSDPDRRANASGDAGTPDTTPGANGPTDEGIGSPADPMADEYRR